jgi:hypothetical protein
MNLIKKILYTATIIAGTGIGVMGMLYGLDALKKSVEYDEEKLMVYQILDKNKDRKLSNEEKRVFNDVTGISPYNHTFNSASSKELSLFLKNYLSK